MLFAVLLTCSILITADGRPGLSAAIALSQRVLKGGQRELTDYIGFLKGGCSKWPLDLLRDAGVDRLVLLPLYPQYSVTTTTEMAPRAAVTIRSMASPATTSTIWPCPALRCCCPATR